MAKLLNRIGRTVCTLEALLIEYPVGRAGSRFEARVAVGALRGVDTTALRFFLIQDDAGERYPATIDPLCADPGDADSPALIRGVLVCRR